MKATLLVDIGSTYTKVVAVDLRKERILGRAEASTTVETNIAVGVRNAIKKLMKRIDSSRVRVEHKFACSSAAGGLRMVTVGLVPRLTVEATKRAALTAGARILGTYSYKLIESDVTRLEQQSPDIILLAGGTNGGDEATIIYNARCIANSKLNVPIVIAGNRVVAREVSLILTESGKEVMTTDNVMPELGKINVHAAQSAIRQVFLGKLIRAKGLEDVERFVANVIMPTPMACLKAAHLLAVGTKREAGLGDLLAVDVGGATTDVYSIASGEPSTPGVVWKGLPEPYEKRTVEGDLGLRSSAISLLEAVGEEKILEKSGLSNIDVEKVTAELSLNVKKLPRTEEEFSLDLGLARVCVETAVARHVGKINVNYTPLGTIYIQYGKDLTKVKHVIGTAGGVVHSRNPRKVLEEAILSPEDPLLLKPKDPTIYVDENYVFYAMGLLSEIAPEKAVRIMKNNLRKL